MKQWFRNLWYGTTSQEAQEAQQQERTRAQQQRRGQPGTMTAEEASKATAKVLGQSNRRKLQLERALYGSPNSTPPVPSMEQKIHTALRRQDRALAGRLAKKKKQLEQQLARIDGQQNNVMRTNALRDEARMNKQVFDIMQANNGVVRQEMGGLDAEDVGELMDDTTDLRDEVSDISDALAFNDPLDDYENEEYLDQLEQQMQEEDAQDALRNFRDVPMRTPQQRELVRHNMDRSQQREDDNNNNNNNNRGGGDKRQLAEVQGE